MAVFTFDRKNSQIFQIFRRYFRQNKQTAKQKNTRKTWLSLSSLWFFVNRCTCDRSPSSPGGVVCMRTDWWATIDPSPPPKHTQGWSSLLPTLWCFQCSFFFFLFFGLFPPILHSVVYFLPRNQIEAADNSGTRPLMFACRGSHSQVADILLEAGADPRSTTSEGSTPLHFAAFAGSLLVRESMSENPALKERPYWFVWYYSWPQMFL